MAIALKVCVEYQRSPAASGAWLIPLMTVSVKITFMGVARRLMTVRGFPDPSSLIPRRSQIEGDGQALFLAPVDLHPMWQ